jgi:UDP-N-acetylmuramate dehydrogenase
LNLQQNISLKPFNTFGIDVSAKYFVEINDENQLKEALDFCHKKKESQLILGGGSNILFTNNFNGVVIKNNLLGYNVNKEDKEYVYVQSNAGENWHQFVCYCVNNNYAGLENLSLIPGSVGASPIQNIGAYGVEIKDCFYELEAYSIIEKRTVIFTHNDCKFGYRESVFKNTLKGEFIIMSVTFRLNKQPKFNTQYGAIEQELDRMCVGELTLKKIAQAVINIRTSKLPDPNKIGNAGSFFKNPMVSNQTYLELKSKYPSIAAYPSLNDTHKLAAGWLIEQCGFKGVRKDNVGTYEKQALVLVNYGNAKGNEVLNFSTEIINTVKEKFNVILEREVNIM